MQAFGEAVRSSRPVGLHRFSGRAFLTAAQVALSTVLLVGTMLFVRSLANAAHAYPGFDLDRVVTVELDPASEQSPAALAAVREATISRIRGIAGVTAVSAADIVPLSMDSRVTSLQIDAGAAARLVSKVNNNFILQEYFRVMGIARLQGRDFTDKDVHTQAAVIVNQTFAKKLSPGGSALGKRVRLPRPSYEAAEPWAEVVGVVADSRYLTLGENPMPLVYWPAKPDMGRLTIHVRSEGDAASLAKLVSGALGTSSARVRPLRAVMAVALFPAQAAAVLLASLGFVGWALTIAGLYGVVTYSVNRRIPEIGVRIALGATPAEILKLIIRDGVAIVAAGLALGLGLSALSSPVLTMLLSGVDPHDRASFAAPAVALLLTAIAAAYGPARKGTRIPPVDALRTD